MVEDAVQETFIRLARHAGDIEGNVGSWLYATATNASIGLLRSEQARKRRERGFADESATTVEPELPSEHEFLVEQCLAELEPDQRCLLVSYYFRGETQREIAARSGVSQVAVKKRIDRALIVLRIKLLKRGLGFDAGGSSKVAAMVPFPSAFHQVAAGIGFALIALAVLRPRASWEAASGVVMVFGACVAALCRFSLRPGHEHAPRFRPSVREPRWVAAAREAVALATGMGEVVQVMVAARRR